MSTQRRNALWSSLIHSPAIHGCRAQLTRQTPNHYRCQAAGSTWVIGAIFWLKPDLVLGSALGVGDGAGERRSLGSGAHAQLGQEVMHMVLDCMNRDA